MDFWGSWYAGSTESASMRPLPEPSDARESPTTATTIDATTMRVAWSAFACLHGACDTAESRKQGRDLGRLQRRVRH